MSKILSDFGKKCTNESNTSKATPSSTITSCDEYENQATYTGNDIVATNISKDLAPSTINVANTAAAIFAGASFNGPVTINVQFKNGT
jgi:hypothetical protein